MTPPTVAPGSAVVMRRHGTSPDAVPSSFCVSSPMKHHQQSHMSSQQENHGGNKKQKKSWGDRLKLGKSERSREQPSSGASTSPDNLMQEYRNKYGTLSSGSALSKSMKYAETWLYGSVAVRSPPSGSTPPRPSLFLCHPPPTVAVIPVAQAVVIPPGTKYAVVMCSCPEFLTGTARSKKDSSVVCKKCGGSRMLWNVSKGGGTVRASGGSAMTSGGTVRAIGGTLRLGSGNSGHSRVRPSLINLSPVSQSIQNSNSSPQIMKSVTPDPYDLMRRNRLGAVNNSEGPLQFGSQGTVRVRAKSTSPCRSDRRSPSPPVSKRTLVLARSERGRLGSDMDLSWEREFSNWNNTAEPADSTKRKSILECDVNAYELIAKYLKNDNRSEFNVDTRSSVDGFCKSRRVDVPSDDDDDVLDDELSDNLSDNALEDSSEGISDITGHKSHKTRVQNTVSCHAKTDAYTRIQDKNLNPATVQPPTRKPCVEKQQNAPISTTLMTNGITLGGQRIRIFNEPPISSSPEDNINVKTDKTSGSEFSKQNDMPSSDSKFDAGTSRKQERLPKNASISLSKIPRLTSPQRPPRKTKASSESPSGCSNNGDVVIQEGEEEEGTENESTAVSYTERAGSSLSQVKDGRCSSSTEGVCIIKSILKKPSTLSPGEISTSFKTFSDTVSKPDYTASSPSVISAPSDQHNLPSPVVPSSGSSDFYLPTFQEYKQQYRRKKQVQFKVSNDIAVLKPLEEEQEADLDHSVTTTPTSAPVSNFVVSSTEIVSDLSPVEEETADAAVLKRLSSVKIDKSIGGDRLEKGFVKEERINDITFLEKEEKKLGLDEEEFVISSDVRDEDKTPICDKDKLQVLVNNTITSSDTNSECGVDRVESVKLQYFGDGDVGVVNSGNVAGGDIASQSGAERGAGDDTGALGNTVAVLGGSDNTETTSADLLRQHRSQGDPSVVSLRRSQSERLLPTDSEDPDRRQTTLPAAGSAALFNDTMRLRLRPGRPDIRQVFSDSGASGTYTNNGSLLDIPNRPKRMLSPGRPRPKEPPPPPPPLSSTVTHEISQQSLPELPPRQIFPFTKKQIELMNQQARQFSIKSNSKQKIISSSVSRVNKSLCDSEQTVSSNVREVSWSPLTNQSTKYSCENVNHRVKKREHRHSDPGPVAPKLVVHIENSPEEQSKEPELETNIESSARITHHPDERKQDSINYPPGDMSKTGNRDETIGRTIVTISSPGSPFLDVHRLQIREEDPTRDVSPGPQRRTSILITSEDSAEATTHLGRNTLVNSSVTSLMIQNDIRTSPVNKDAINKVTISVGGLSDHLPPEINNQNTGNTSLSSSCTIIDTSPSSTLNSRNMYNNSNGSSFTLLSSKQINVIPVSQEQQVRRTLFVVDPHDNEEASDDTVLRCWNNNSSVPVKSADDIRVVKETVTVASSVEDYVRETASSGMLASKTRGVNLSAVSPAAEDADILLNPVEAVKRNLVPHVCGKKDLTLEDESAVTISSPTDKLKGLAVVQKDTDDHERETLKEGDYLVTAPASKLRDVISNDDDPWYSNVSTAVSKISEDILPTVIEQEEEGDGDVFHAQEPPLTEAEECPKPFSNLDDEDCKTDSGSLDVESGDKAIYSIIPENDGIASRDEGDDTTSTSQISVSETFKGSVSVDIDKSDQADEEDLRDNKNGSCSEPDNELEEENIYDSIKDPIYEEIPDTPPPLPLSPPPSLDDLEEMKRVSRSIFEGASKYDILSYLVGAKERGILPEETYYNESANGDEIIEILDGKPVHEEEEGVQSHQRMTSLDLGDLSSRVSQLSNASDSSEDSCNIIISSIGESPSSPNKVRKSSAEIERNDSGVGSETSKSSRSRWQHCGPATSIREDQQLLCEDCDQPVETQVSDSGVMFAPLVCRKCGKKRAERKEIIAEIVETEEKYGRDLQIIMEEFYRPMLVAGLLTPEHLAAIFLNVEELLEHNIALAEKLRDAMEIALEQGDEDLLTVNIGKLFLEASPMLHAFESYCIRQGAASLLLANLEKEKELLRIFLRVSQMENAVLRRMNLNSFLMVPVQRVTKYPLLLARLYKVTPPHHESRELLRQSQQKIELHLEHMNSEAKDISTTKLWRRISIMNGRRSSSETDMLSIKLRKMALDILEWNHDEVRFAMEGKLLYTNPTDNNWRKGRTIKLNPINALLVTNGKPTDDYRPDPSEDALMFPRKTGVREATLLLLKEKCGRYMQLREPLYLDKCIVCSEADWEGYFEVQELASKDTFIFKADCGDQTKLWYRQLQYHAQGMGAWRRRRNALANIMINGMQTRN